jgi:hypothetical protein
VREYVNEHATDIAEAFGISADMLRAGIAVVDDDARMARRLLAEVDRARKEGREGKARERVRAAQEAADAVGTAVRWREDCAEIDLGALLATALTSPGDVLVFASETFTVGVRMAALLRLRQLRRRDMWAFVDRNGLHIRWGLAGGLNLPPCVEPTASRVVVNLAARAAACVAA